MSIEPRPNIDPNVGIPDLLRRLADDSKRLADDEVRLAKLEMRENMHTGMRGVLRLVLAFGAGTIAMVGLTIGLSALIGRLIGHNYWLGAMVVGLIELGLAAFLVKKGIEAYRKPSYTLEQTRASLKDTRAWVAAPRAD